MLQRPPKTFLLAVLLAAGCTSTGTPPQDAPPTTVITAGAEHAPVTINLWTFNHLDREVTAFRDAIARLHAKYPWLTVTFTPNRDDATFAKAQSAGQPPDVLVSTGADNVAKFCRDKTIIDLAPYAKVAGLDLDATFPKAALVYGRYQGQVCALPLLTDSYALYYNKKMFAAAGITAPPRTLSELQADAAKLTVRNADGGIRTFGFVSRSDYDFNIGMYYGVGWGANFYGPDGRTTFAADPRWAQMLTWDRTLNDSYGPGNVEKFVQRYQGHTDDAGNAFLKGAVAMEFDGEWHVGEIKDADPAFDYGVAPMPVSDDQPGRYGAGNTAGTVVVIPTGSTHKQEAWFAVQQLTTDSDFINTLAAATSNVPSTYAALAASPLKNDPHFKPFIDVFLNPGSYYKATGPAGTQDIDSFGVFVGNWERGKVGDLQAGLTELGTRIDRANQQ